MRSMFRLASGVLLLVASSCADSSGPATFTPEELSGALLVVTDMDEGWKETQRQVFDERGPENPSIDPSIWCSDADALTEDLVDLAGQSGADVEMSRESVDGGGSELMRLQAWSNGDVDLYMDAALAAAAACDGWVSTGESGVETSIDLLPKRTIGEESVSWIQSDVPSPSLAGEKWAWYSRTTIARFGSVVMVLQWGSVAPGDTVEPADEDEWWRIVEVAGNRLARLAE